MFGEGFEAKVLLLLLPFIRYTNHRNIFSFDFFSLSLSLPDMNIREHLTHSAAESSHSHSCFFTSHLAQSPNAETPSAFWVALVFGTQTQTHALTHTRERAVNIS